MISFWLRPAVADCAQALKPGAPLAHRGAPSNLAAFIPIDVGNTDAAFAQAAHVFRERLFQHRGGPFFMECRGMIAVPDPVGEALTIYVSSQGPHRHKRVLLDLLDWADHQLRRGKDLGHRLGIVRTLEQKVDIGPQDISEARWQVAGVRL